MPELPEVEVLRLSLLPRILEQRIERVEIRSPALREPFDRRALQRLAGQEIAWLRRRSKYLLIDTRPAEEPGTGREHTLVIHLGMSGRLTLVDSAKPPEKHEHIAFHLRSGQRLRLVDPRRFGLVFCRRTEDLEADRKFLHLGPEPLESEFGGHHLQERAKNRRGPVKTFLMDARVVVGVGNIYACESLWRTRLHPMRSVGRVSAATWDRLAGNVKTVLSEAIGEGGTTLNDFADGEGNAGYFQVSLNVYGRDGEPCLRCGRNIRRRVLGGRGTFYCPGCQH